MRTLRPALPLLLVLSLVLSACSFWGVGCPLIGIYSVQVEVRDTEGASAANGATVTIRDTESYEASARGFGERVFIHVGEDNRSGPFTVEVTKPYHESATVENVRTPVSRCGLVESAQVAVTLRLEPDAPPVRQVVVPEGPYGYAGGYEDQVTAYIEAAPGVSREVSWSSSDPSVITVTPDGRTQAVCHDAPRHAFLKATSVADPSKYGVLEVSVALPCV